MGCLIFLRIYIAKLRPNIFGFENLDFFYSLSWILRDSILHPGLSFTFLIMLSQAINLLLLAQVLASPIEALERNSCPPIHVFGARETTAPAGMGTEGVVFNLITQAHSEATSEAINYPACGGQSACGGVSYSDSAKRGVAVVVSAVDSFNSSCPNTQLVLVGYSQICDLP